MRIVMLAGDSQRTADAVARQLGIDEAIGEVLPEEKAKHVQRLQSEGHKVAMAGDGINECCSGYLRQTARQIFRWSMARQSNWKSTGFAKQFSQPHSVARRHQSAWLPFPLSTMIRMSHVEESPRSVRIAVIPVMRGMLRSIKITSGCVLVATSTASHPLATSSTVCPSICSNSRMDSRTSA